MNNIHRLKMVDLGDLIGYEEQSKCMGIVFGPTDIQEWLEENGISKGTISAWPRPSAVISCFFLYWNIYFSFILNMYT